MKQTLTLTKNDGGDDAIFRTTAADAGRGTLNKISCFMPDVMPADKEKMELHKIIEKKDKLQVGYRMRQCDSITVPQSTSFSWRLSVKSSPEVPRFIIVSFQTNKSGNQRQIHPYSTT